jgi:hypothetical protein
MSEISSIFATALGILMELLALIGLARLLDAPIPKRTLLICFSVGIGLASLIVSSVAVGLSWGVEPIVVACLLLALIPPTSLGAWGILATVQWFNRRDDSSGQSSLPESGRRT